MRIRLLLAAALLLSSTAFAQQSQLPSNTVPAPFGSQLPNNQDPFNQQSQLPNGAGAAGPPPVNCSPVNGLDYTKACDTVYFMGVFQ